MNLRCYMLGLLVVTSSFLVTSASKKRKSAAQTESSDTETDVEKKELSQLIRLIRTQLNGHTKQNTNGQNMNSVCSPGEVIRMAGSIESPNYPLDYANYLDCVWIIEGPPGSHIQMEFPEEVAIEGGVAGCYDYLEIRDGGEASSDPLDTICGFRSVQNVITTQNKAYIQFHSDFSYGFTGFYFDFTFEGISGCSGIRELTVAQGSVKSPGYPHSSYDNNANCGWQITAPAGKTIQVTFVEFELEEETDCLYDSLSIYDGGSETDSLLGKYCSTNSPGQVTSAGNTLLLVFSTDFSETRKGFKFDYTTQEEEDTEKPTPACTSDRPQVIEAEMGEFSTEGFSENKDYKDNSRCSWKIIVPPTKRAHLHFGSFQLEPAEYCKYDSVRVYDGENASGVPLGTYCGNTGPGDISATGNVIFVQFKSDSSLTARGFSVIFSGKDKPEPGDETCGIPAISPKFPRIVGGIEAIPHSWPWQVSLRYFDHPNTPWDHWCGGSIIANEWVLTAAHCVTGSKEKFKVIAGAHNRDSTDASQVTIEVRNIIVHELYDSNTSDNDIALFRLATPVTYTAEVSPVCLPTTDVTENTLCITTGWGATEGTANNDVLQQVDVPIVNHVQCSEWYELVGGITENMLCAGYPEGRKDSCQGDSGGPLVCNSGTGWSQVGITSFGLGCADVNKPGVYSRVTKYIDWINQNTGVGVP